MSYDESLSTNLDIARFRLGDTSNDPATELLPDDQIDAVLTLYPPLAIGIAMLAEGLATKYAQKPSSVGLPSGMSVAWSERIKRWVELAALLRATGSLTGAATAFSIGLTRNDGYTELADAEAA